MNYVLGASGRLGRAIASSLLADGVTALDRGVYAGWWQEGAVEQVFRFFDTTIKPGTIYVAAGLIDPRMSSEEHLRVNYMLARNVVKGATKAGFRVVTFGTVMEAIIGDSPSNSYIASKYKLGCFVDEFSIESALALHIRIHTLFGGGDPDGFMFLGQIFQSLVARSEFKMSPGNQLREYHHVEDEVAGITKLAESGGVGSITLSHGVPVRLKDIATHVFEEFQCPELLQLGALPGPVDDNYKMTFQSNPALEGINFRQTLPAVTAYLRECVNHQAGRKYA